MVNWTKLRNNLFNKFPKGARDKRAHAVRSIAKYMNLMQHYYGELFKEVGTNGRLIVEASLVVFGYDGAEHGKDAYSKINAAKNAGAISPDTAAQLHELRTASNKGVHFGTKDFTPNDKPLVANAAFRVASLVYSDL